MVILYMEASYSYTWKNTVILYIYYNNEQYNSYNEKYSVLVFYAYSVTFIFTLIHV